MNHLTPEQFAYIIQFQHPRKSLAHLPGMCDAAVAGLFGLTPATYGEIVTAFDQRARRAALDLLADADVRGAFERMPFSPGQTIVGFGDSITDDLQSWFEILRHMAAEHQPAARLRFVNAAISGDTTTQLISRFMAVIAEQPDWIICFVGANDTRLHGEQPLKTLVSSEETAKNLAMLCHYAATQTTAKWVWMTPTPVISEKIRQHWFLGPMQMMWRNEDLDVVADLVRARAEPVVDLQAAFGDAPDAALLLDDGLHPSLAGQMTIVRALLARLAADQRY